MVFIYFDLSLCIILLKIFYIEISFLSEHLTMKTLNFPADIQIDSLPDIKNRIGYLSINVPEEIIIAADKMPYRILGSGKPVKRANAYLPKTFDPYVLDCFESALEGKYKFLDGVIVANISDAHRRMYDVWRTGIDSINTFILDLPKSNNNLSIKSFKHALLCLVRDMEKVFNTEISDEKLNDAIELCNETRLLLKGISECRKKHEQPFTSTEFFQIVKWSQINDKRKANKILKEYLLTIDELNKYTEHTGAELISGKSPRIMVMGSIMVSPEIISILEKLNAKIVCEDQCIGIPYFDTLVDQSFAEPLEAIAKRYLRIPTARMVDTEARWKYLLKMANEFEVDGIIYFALKFDDIYLFEYPHLRDKFRKAGFPILFVEAENFFTTLGQIGTRVQAFVEMLEENMF